MFKNRLLKFTFSFSILLHGVVLLPFPALNPFAPAPKLQKIAVRYVKEKPLLKSLPKDPALQGQYQEQLLREPLNTDLAPVASKKAPLPYFEAESLAPAAKDRRIASARQIPLPESLVNRTPADFAKPAFINSQALAIKKKITLPAIETAKIDNPSYISYYQVVREKIRRSAYQNYTHNETGEVYVSFIISNDGLIKDVRLAEDKTSVSGYLKSTALKSIRDASPFPNFPKELDYPQLSFNIIISFEVE